jgi:hypothetical protein
LSPAFVCAALAPSSAVPPSAACPSASVTLLSALALASASELARSLRLCFRPPCPLEKSAAHQENRVGGR